MEKPIVPILFTLLLILNSATARGDSRKEARIHFEQGVELYNAGKLEEAAIEFERAYELHPSYKILFNLAQAEAELQHYSRALSAYQAYLKEGGDDIAKERREVVEKEVSRLQTLVGYLSIPFQEAGATVMVDGERRATTPLAEDLTVDVGKHEVSIIQQGKMIHREIVRIAGRETVSVVIPVAVDPEGPTETKSTIIPEDVVSTPTDTSQAPLEHPLKEPEKTKRIWTWIAFGIGGAAAVGAAITGALSLTKKSDVEDGCVKETKICPATLADEATQVATLALTTDILIGTAALGLALGTVFYFIEPKFGPKSGREKREMALLPVLNGDTFGLSLGRRF